MRNLFLDKIDVEEFEWCFLANAFQHPVTFTEEQFSKIDKLFSHKNKHIRRAIKGILKQDNIPVNQRIKWQKKLSGLE